MNERLLTRGVSEVIVKEDLEKALRQAQDSGQKLRVKLGIDPTAPDLHLGHTVPLRKLRQFQDAGHQAVLIIGDFTAMIGDPSGRTGAREPLTEEQVQKNLKKFLEQAGKVLDLKTLEVRYNSEWLSKLSIAKWLELQGKCTVAQIIDREDFRKRLHEGTVVGLQELSYPVMQAYDSVMVKADIELGGVDQKLNLITGRELMGKMGIKAQNILLVPLIEGTDGIKKMSKSLGNYIALDADPNEMFGKIMAVPDGLLPKYYECLTDAEFPLDENPRTAKIALGRIIVEMYHGQKAAEAAVENFINVFSNKEKPKDMPELRITDSELRIVDLLLMTGVKSKSEARRLIEQGGVKIDDEVKNNPNEIIKIKNESILQIGKRKFFKLTL
ncbi:MAG: tyrosine--tRNA ligase [Patescibacteria group bacterium]